MRNFHSSDKYTYAIYIKSQSGDGAPFASLSRFDGTTIYFNNYDVETFFRPKVTPGFFICTIYYLTIPTSKSDSIIVQLSQNTFHKNVPDLPYKLPSGAVGDRDGQANNFGNYPMGLHNITINKYKSGIHTLSYDSIYLGWGATKSHTINW